MTHALAAARAVTDYPDLKSGAAVFARLQQLGIDVVFANSGTDFPSIIEGPDRC